MAYDEALADRIRELISGETGVTEQKMFGGLAFLIGGNMAVAASGPTKRLAPVCSRPPRDLARSRATCGCSRSIAYVAPLERGREVLATNPGSIAGPTC